MSFSPLTFVRFFVFRFLQVFNGEPGARRPIKREDRNNRANFDGQPMNADEKSLLQVMRDDNARAGFPFAPRRRLDQSVPRLRREVLRPRAAERRHRVFQSELLAVSAGKPPLSPLCGLHALPVGQAAGCGRSVGSIRLEHRHRLRNRDRRQTLFLGYTDFARYDPLDRRSRFRDSGLALGSWPTSAPAGDASAMRSSGSIRGSLMSFLICRRS